MTIVFNEEKYEQLFTQMKDQADIEIYDSPLAAFAHQEAVKRVNDVMDYKEIPDYLVERCVDETASELEDYLFENEQAMDYDAFDDLTEEAVDAILEEKNRADERTALPVSVLGHAREIVFFQNNKSVKNERKPGEIFYGVEMRNGTKAYGYMERTEAMESIYLLPGLVQENKENMHISFIEWGNTMNVVFEDGVYIGSIACSMKKSDFISWYNQNVDRITEPLATE